MHPCRRIFFTVSIFATVIAPAAPRATEISATPSLPKCFLLDKPVTLTGFYGEFLFPEEPNYQSVKQGDARALRGVLLLEVPICISPNDVVEGAQSIEALQVNCDDAHYRAFKRHEGEEQTISGVLEPGETGHHRGYALLPLSAKLLKNI